MADPIPIGPLFPHLGGRVRRVGFAEVTIGPGANLVVFDSVLRFSPRALPQSYLYVETTTTTSTNAWAESTDGAGARAATLEYRRRDGKPANQYDVRVRNRWEEPNGNPIPIDVQIFHTEVEP